MRLENPFSPNAISQWQQDVRQAWANRATSPDAYLMTLPLPGHRLASGPLIQEEEALFAARLEEFRRENWPLTYWVRKKA